MPRQFDVLVDVTQAAALGETAQLAITLVLPDRMPPSPVVCFAIPSGGYSRHYFTSDLPGPARGMQATWHAERGWIFVAIDLLGMGDSTQHDHDSLDFETLAAAVAAAEQEILLRLANNLFDESYPLVNQPTVIGIGHSLGAALTIYQQANHRTFDGIVALGFSALHSHPTAPPGQPAIQVAWYSRESRLADGREPLNGPELSAGPVFDRNYPLWQPLSYAFHYDDVPEQVVEEELNFYEEMRSGQAMRKRKTKQVWKSITSPRRVARSILSPGVVAMEAAAITIPVLSAMGERDLVISPQSESFAFRSTRDFQYFICPKMGHMHNFASTRTTLWNRIQCFGNWCNDIKNTFV